MSEVGKEDPPAYPNDFADFVRCLTGVLIEHFGISQLNYIGSRPPSGLPPRPTRLEQQQSILKLFDYRSCDAAAKEELWRKAQRIAMLSTQPVFILREVLQHLIHQRIVAPGYTYLQDMVGRTVSSERLRVTSLLGRALTPEVEELLEAGVFGTSGRKVRLSISVRRIA